MKAKILTYVRLSTALLYGVLTAVALAGNRPAEAVFLLGSSVVLGPWFCGWACLFGALQDVVRSFGTRVLRVSLRIPRRVERFLFLCRYAVLVLSLFVSATLFVGEPRSVLFRMLFGSVSDLALGIWIYIAVLGVASLFMERPFCRYLCAQGAVLGASGVLRLFSVGRDSESCLDCGGCDRACPMNISVSERSVVRSPQCINCLQCVAVCPNTDTLKYGFFPFWRSNRQNHLDPERIEFQ